MVDKILKEQKDRFIDASDKRPLTIHTLQNFFRIHKLPILIIILFFILSYIFISSDYNHVKGDAGLYARYAEVLCETNKIDIIGTAATELGQLFFAAIFCKIFGFSLKILHLTVYIISFLSLVALYLLLLELGLNRFLALFGSLTLLINPISLKMIDWYITEPFFICYLIFALLFLSKAFRLEKSKYFYYGNIFCVMAILTRQHAISIPATLILICLIYRKKIKKNILIHCIISSTMPIISVGLFYVFSFALKSTKGSVGLPKANIEIIKNFVNPSFLLSRLYFDIIFSLHYIALYLTPLFIIIFISLLIHPKKIKQLYSNLIISTISILFISIGTIFLYIRYNRLMPYIPNIFSITSLQNVFNFNILTVNTASSFLTIFTWIGAIITLIKILEYFFSDKIKQYSLKTNKEKVKKKSKKKEKDYTVDLNKKFFYFWGIIYILVTILIGLRYDRYIFPLSVLMIYVILSHFSWIGRLKKTFILVFFLIFLIFIYKIVANRLKNDLIWGAGYYLLNENIPPHEINGTLAFNLFYNFYHIRNLYKNIRVKRRIKWLKFHPLARFFISSRKGLHNKNPGLILYKTFSKKRWFGLLKMKSYIYKRKEGYSGFIWL